MHDCTKAYIDDYPKGHPNRYFLDNGMKFYCNPMGDDLETLAEQYNLILKDILLFNGIEKDGDGYKYIPDPVILPTAKPGKSWIVTGFRAADLALSSSESFVTEDGVVTPPNELGECEEILSYDETTHEFTIYDRCTGSHRTVLVNPVVQSPNLNLSPNQLLAYIATSQHYAQLLALNNDPTALLSDTLALDGQGLSVSERTELYHRWLWKFLHYSPQYSGASTEELEAVVREDLIRRIDNISIARGWEARQRFKDNEDLYATWGIQALIDELNYFISLGELGIFAIDLEVVENYYNFIDQAEITAILEDWNQEREQELLDELNGLITEIPSNILGIPVEWVVLGIADYYGKMKARHEMLSATVAPQQEAQRLRDEQNAAARELYLEYLHKGVDEGIRNPDDWVLWEALPLDQLQIEAYQVANELEPTGSESEQIYSYVNFEDQIEIIYGLDPNRGLWALANAASLVLSFFPVVGTVVDIIEGINALRQGDLWGVAFSLLGPLGDAARAMRTLRATGDVASDILRGTDTVAEVSEQVLEARRALDTGILDEFTQRADELEEAQASIEEASRELSLGQFGGKRRPYTEVEDLVPTQFRPVSDNKLIYPPEWVNLSEAERREIFANAETTLEAWAQTDEARRINSYVTAFKADPTAFINVAWNNPSMIPFSYYGMSVAQARLGREGVQFIDPSGRIFYGFGLPREIGINVPKLAGELDWYVAHTHPLNWFEGSLVNLGLWSSVSTNDTKFLQDIGIGFGEAIIPSGQNYIIYYWNGAGNTLEWTKIPLPYHLR